MSSKNKLTNEILNKIYKLAREGYNCSEISVETGFKRQTINYWKKKYKINIQSYGPREGYLKYLKFLEILDDAYGKNKKIKLNQTLREIGLHSSTAQSILKKHPKYKELIQNKKTQQKYIISDLQQFAKEKDGECHSLEYIKNSTKYIWECKDGHIWESTWNDVKNGKKWCSICGYKTVSNKLKKYNIQNLKKFAHDKDGQCLSDEYSNYMSKYKWKCDKNHTWEASWSDVKSGEKWCKECGYQKSGAKNRKYKVIDLKNHAQKENGECLSNTYTSIKEYYKWKCDKNHTWEASWDGIKRGNWCPYCSTQHSKAELELLEWVRQWHPKAHSTRQVIQPKEIDIYIPELNLGIEYCGLYWHNENSPHPRGRNYHKEKMLQCQENGIRLITIFEDEWVNRNAQVKNFLKSVMNINSRRIYARKCDIKEVEKEVAHRFLNDHHIQGKAPLKIAFGLYYEEELLGLITGNGHHRKNDQFTLNRLVFKDEVQIIGGASKLLKHLVGYAKKEGFEKLISWSDNRYSQGNVYEKCGFELEEELSVDYSYITPELERQSKQSNKKANLLKKGAIGTMANTETELAESLGYSKMWDCGKKRFVINL